MPLVPTLRPFLRVLGFRGRLAMGISSLASFSERIAIVAVTLEVVGDRPVRAAGLAGFLAAVIVARSALRSFLRRELHTRMIEAVSAALLADDAPLDLPRTSDFEMSLLEGLHAVERIVGDVVPELLADVPACALVLALAGTVLPARLVLEATAIVSLGVIVLIAARRSSAQSGDTVWQAYESVLADLSIAVRGSAEIVASGTAGSLATSLRAKTQRWRTLSARASLQSFLGGRAPSVAMAFGAGLVLILDERVQGPLFHGVLGRAAILSSMTPAFSGLVRASLELGRSSARTRPIARAIARGERAGSTGREAPPARGALTVDRVHFAYAAEAPSVIEDISFGVDPGEVIVLTGPNGSGKSTLLALLVGLLRPTAGVVRIGPLDLRHVDRRLLRQRMGYLPQRPYFPDGASVRSAMHLLAPDVDDAELERALRSVDLWPVLVARGAVEPLDVAVGSLSAGERQRLALARILARRPTVLLLDEPDANLDSAGLEVLASLLRELAPGRSIVMSAHSPRLVAAADRVIRLGGRSSAACSIASASPHARPTSTPADAGS